MGYRNVYVFREGLPGWIKAGYPTTTIEKLPKVDVPTLSPAELKSMLDAGEKLVLLDIRIPTEAKGFWIEHSDRRHIVINQLPGQVGQLPRDRKMVVVDLNGKRSPVAARYLHAQGFSDIVKLSGGMHQWVKDGQPTTFAK